MVEGRGWLLRRNWILPLIGLVAVLVGLEYDALVRPGYAAGVWGLFFAWIGGSVAIATLLRNAFRLARPTSWRATADGLVIDGRPLIPAHAIAEAKVRSHVIRQADTLIDLKLTKAAGRQPKRIALSLARADADALLGVLGIGPGGRRSAFPIVIPFLHRLLAVAVVLGLPFFLFLLATTRHVAESVFVFAFSVVPFLLLLSWLAGALRGKVVVGAEGFSVRWLRERFVSFADVAVVDKVERTSGVEIRVIRHDNELIRLQAVEIPETDAQRLAEGRALFNHLEAAFLRWNRERGLADAGAHLKRNERSAREWLRGLDALVRQGGSGYRMAALTPELLREVARRTDGEAEARVGAAAALVRLNPGEAEYRATVRIAAEACAESPVREALLGLAEAESDAVFEKALARVIPGR